MTSTPAPKVGLRTVEAVVDAATGGGRKFIRGAPDRASPNFIMGLASLGLEISILCDFIYSVLLVKAIWG
jgi:hypothetical protein